MPIVDDLKSLDSMVKTIDDQLKTLSDTLDMNVTVTYGFNIGIKSEIKKYSLDQIKNLTLVQLDSILKNGFDGKGENNNREALTERYQNNEDYKDKDILDYAINVFSEIKSGLNDIEEVKTQRDNIKTDIEKAMTDYFGYINSAEYKAKKKAKIEEMRAKAESEQDETAKRKITEMLEAMDKSESFDFLLTRIKERGDAEIDDIVYAFFNSNKSRVIMDKYSSAIKRLGYNKDIYKMFFNLEEKFLSDEYNKFNNLFLFVLMRYIAYSNPYSKDDTLCINAALNKIYNLIYHKYEAKEQEEQTIKFVAIVDDYFKDYAEKFIECNTTSPDHPERIRRDKEYDEKRRMMVISSLQNEGIEVDTSLDTDVLKQMLEDVIEKKQHPETEETVEEAPITEEATTNEFSENESTGVEINSNEDLADLMEKITNSEHLAEMEKLEEDIDTDALKLSAIAEEAADSEDTVEVEVVPENTRVACEGEPKLVDIYGYSYIKMTDGTYDYVDENGEFVEGNFDEDTILKLMSSGALTKQTD